MKPTDSYNPQVLVLAPEGGKGDDANALSLASQLLEMGVAIELDENWMLPTRPPRPLSAYRACLFPDTATQYEAELDAFYRGGGFVPYFKYYPTATVFSPVGVHHFAGSYGRDAYFYHAANALIEGNPSVPNADFLRTLGAHPLDTIVPELRREFFRQDRPIDVWRSWGDPIYTMIVNNFALGEAAGEAAWVDLARRCLVKMCDSKQEAISRRASENQLPDTADIYTAMFGELFILYGRKFEDARMTATGIELIEFFLPRAAEQDGFVRERWMRCPWSECLAPVPALYQAWSLTGDTRYRAMADATLHATVEACQSDNGLWYHWVGLGDVGGGKGSFWSRGTQWPLLWMTRALEAVDADSESGRLMLDRIRRTFDALRHHQTDRGPWRLVIDDPHTRFESTATAAIVYCHDRLRERGLIDGRHDEMIERAFVGLKTLYYARGVAGACRGTGIGTGDYYRTRPLGHAVNSLFAAACAVRGSRVEESR